jgi:glycosyltransferase involved in cell wall biosynthesis
MVRLHYMNEGFERLGLPITYVDPSLEVRLNEGFERLGPIQYLNPSLAVRRLGLAFVARFFLTRLGLALLNPFRRPYLIVNGTPPAVGLVKLMSWRGEPLFFDVHDDPRLQFRDLGIQSLRDDELEVIANRLDFVLATFRLLGFTTLEFSDLFDVEDERKVLAPNASDPRHFLVTPLPDRPVVALVGSTSPGRGSDLLIEACALARAELPDLTLQLALDNIGGRGNLAELQRAYREPWVVYRRVDYRALPQFLAESTVCVVPHKNRHYLDFALPIKLYDYMAAARPVVVTRCERIAEFVEVERVGLVCDFTPEDMASKIVTLLRDRELAESLGRNGRAKVEERDNWRRTQDDVLAAVRRELNADRRSSS